MDDHFEQFRKDAAHARRLAEKASDNLARELIAIADELENATKIDAKGETEASTPGRA